MRYTACPDLRRYRQPVDQRLPPHSREAGERDALVFGPVFIVAGLGFKLGAAPFHMWVPDVYQGAPTAVTLLIGTAPELAAFAFVLRILVEALGAQVLLHQWQGMLILLSVLSMAIGNITAIAQTSIKRMLAYSTISHMGFMLLGFLSGTAQGYGASMFYIAVYVLTVIGAFAMIMLRRGGSTRQPDDFKGLNQRNPWYAFIMLLLMFRWRVSAAVASTPSFRYSRRPWTRGSSGWLWLLYCSR
jgi:NADH-quinone oxidoreductase subunit N